MQDGGTDLLGDGSADITTVHLERIAEKFRSEHKRLPTLEELLASVRDVLSKKADDLIADGSGAILSEIVAVVLPDRVTVSSQGWSPKMHLVLQVSAMLEEIHDEYEEMLDRKPTLRELLGNVAFVLGVEPDGYIAIEPNCSIDAIEARLL